MTAPKSFSQADLLRAIKTAIKAGLRVAGIEITKDGAIRLDTSERGDAEREPEDTWADV